MNIGITLETDRISASSVNLDGITQLYSIDNNSEGRKTNLSTKVLIKGNQAYVGDLVEMIRLELPQITASSYFINKNTTQSFYQDENTKEWSSTQLLAILLKKVKNEVEKNSIEKINTYTLSISNDVDQKKIQEMHKAFEYNDINISKTIKHDHSVAYFLLNEIRKKAIDDKELKVISFHADVEVMKFSSLLVDQDKIKHISNSTATNQGLGQITEHISNFLKKEFENSQGMKFRSHAENEVLLFEYAKMIYIHLFIKNKKSYAGSLILNSKLIYININKEDLQDGIDSLFTNFKNGISAVINESNWTLDEIDKIVMTGSQSNLTLLREFLSILKPELVDKAKFSIRNDILAKGTALSNHIDFTSIDMNENSEMNIKSPALTKDLPTEDDSKFKDLLKKMIINNNQ